MINIKDIKEYKEKYEALDLEYTKMNTILEDTQDNIDEIKQERNLLEEEFDLKFLPQFKIGHVFKKHFIKNAYMYYVISKEHTNAMTSNKIMKENCVLFKEPITEGKTPQVNISYFSPSMLTFSEPCELPEIYKKWLKLNGEKYGWKEPASWPKFEIINEEK